MPKIIIIGAGISGLSCAFDLITRGFDVEIYERSDTSGGQAKSIRTPKCNVPYAWRIWSNFYYNFLDVTSKIPTDNTKTIRDNLVLLPTYTHELKNKYGRQYSGGSSLDKSNFKDSKSYYSLLNKIYNMFLFSEKRLRDNDITFYDYINPQDKATEDWLMEFAGPIIGMEAKKVTLFSIVKGWEMTYMSSSLQKGFEKNDIYVANGPYLDVIFNPWVDFLKKKGVKFYTNTNIISLNYDNKLNKIMSIDTDELKNIKADDFIICIDQNSINKLIKPNDDLMEINMLKNSTELKKYGNQMYFGMLLYFSEAFDPPLGTGCAQEQPWKVVIENYSASWSKKYIEICGTTEIVQASSLDLSSGLNGKILSDCSVEEAIKETIDQLKLSKLMKNLKTVSGKSIWDPSVFTGYEIWPEWVNDENNKIKNKNDFYKFSINKKCWDLMPSTKTPVSNLFFGSVITKTELPMISMEMACTNGRLAAKSVSEKYDIKPAKVSNHPGYLPIVLSPFRTLDHLLFSMGIKSNIYVITVIILIIFTILFLIITVKFVIKYFRCCILSKNHLLSLHKDGLNKGGGFNP